ncbi:HGxxPAAW family protein [Uniformispora flossi]|uniref:HGxxPAAW family protein n=1 Tax=Uniformispora flossi TaxID=3390723 RepID=UPI003C2CEB2A
MTQYAPWERGAQDDRGGSNVPKPGRHGHSVAAWTGAVVVLVGAVTAACGLPLAEPWLFWTGVGLIAVGSTVGLLLSRLGFGVPPAYRGEGDLETHDEVFGAAEANRSDGATRNR